MNKGISEIAVSRSKLTNMQEDSKIYYSTKNQGTHQRLGKNSALFIFGRLSLT